MKEKNKFDPMLVGIFISHALMVMLFSFVIILLQNVLERDMLVGLGFMYGLSVMAFVTELMDIYFDF